MHIILRYEMERALIRGDLAVEDVSTVACFPLLHSPNACCQGITPRVACGACRLFSHTLSQPQVPEVWNAKMEEYLGVTPANDAQGCLQDVHWSAGRELRRHSALLRWAPLDACLAAHVSPSSSCLIVSPFTAVFGYFGCYYLGAA